MFIMNSEVDLYVLIAMVRDSVGKSKGCDSGDSYRDMSAVFMRKTERLRNMHFHEIKWCLIIPQVPVSNSCSDLG